MEYNVETNVMVQGVQSQHLGSKGKRTKSSRSLATRNPVSKRQSKQKQAVKALSLLPVAARAWNFTLLDKTALLDKHIPLRVHSLTEHSLSPCPETFRQ